MSTTDKTVIVTAALVVAVVFAVLAVWLVIPMLVRPKPHVHAKSCINNLRQMDGAIQQWALETQKKPEDGVALKDIMPYLKGSVACPQGGTYRVGPTVSCQNSLEMSPS